MVPWILFGYAVGSVPFAYLLARRAGIDVRVAGSGLPGAPARRSALCGCGGGPGGARRVSGGGGAAAGRGAGAGGRGWGGAAGRGGTGAPGGGGTLRWSERPPPPRETPPSPPTL